MVCNLATDRILHHVVASLFVIDLDVNVTYRLSLRKFCMTHYPQITQDSHRSRFPAVEEALPASGWAPLPLTEDSGTESR